MLALARTQPWRPWACSLRHFSIQAQPGLDIGSLCHEAASPAPSAGEVKVHGWVRQLRVHKKVAFLEIHDGSQLAGLQVVLSPELTQGCSLGSSVRVRGLLVKSLGAGQALELQASHLDIIGDCPTLEYPIQKQSHTLEFLRTMPHLRLRTKRAMAVMRVRHQAAMAIHRYFDANGYLLIPTPILTGHDCEGGGEVFSLAQPAASTEPFFAQPAHLTVSGQLHLEAAAASHARVYTFGPTFRAEPHHTHRHLAEFWMLEAELAFERSLASLLDHIEDMLRFVTRSVLEKCEPELMHLFEAPASEKGLSAKTSQQEPRVPWTLDALKAVAYGTPEATPFVRMTYTEAVERIQRAAAAGSLQLQFPLEWGMALKTEHEQWLAADAGGPVFVTDYPAATKPFYMRVNRDTPNSIHYQWLFIYQDE